MQRLPTFTLNRMLNGVLATILCAGLVSCNAAPRPTQAPDATETPEHVTERFLAELIGELTIDGDCVLVEGHVLVWHADINGTVEDEKVTIVDGWTGETTTWRTGQTIAIWGGEASYLSLSRDVRDDLLIRCPDYQAAAYWLVGNAGRVP